MNLIAIKKQKKAKADIIVNPKFFDKPIKVKKDNKKIKKYEEDEINNYDENKNVPQFEEFAFVPNSGGSGFIVGDGEYVITNIHVIENAKKIAVRNGKVRNAKVLRISKNYDLAILELKNHSKRNFLLMRKIC